MVFITHTHKTPMQLLCSLPFSSVLHALRAVSFVHSLCSLHSSPENGPATPSVAIAVCSCLTQFALDDQNAWIIRKCNGYAHVHHRLSPCLACVFRNPWLVCTYQDVVESSHSCVRDASFIVFMIVVAFSMCKNDELLSTAQIRLKPHILFSAFEQPSSITVYLTCLCAAIVYYYDARLFSSMMHWVFFYLGVSCAAVANWFCSPSFRCSPSSVLVFPSQQSTSSYVFSLEHSPCLRIFLIFAFWCSQ